MRLYASEFALHILYMLINVCTVYFEFNSLQYRVKGGKKSWVKEKQKELVVRGMGALWVQRRRHEAFEGLCCSILGHWQLEAKV